MAWCYDTGKKREAPLNAKVLKSSRYDGVLVDIPAQVLSKEEVREVIERLKNSIE